MKKAFTLIELIFVVIVITFLTFLGLKQYVEKKKANDLDALVNKIVLVTGSYVLDTNIGYLNGSGGYCSDDNTFNKVDAWRSINCAKFLNKPFSAYKGNSSESTQDACSYIEIGDTVLNTDSGTACELHFYNNGDKTLYVEPDCHFIKNTRTKELLEKLLISAFKKNFPSVYSSSNQNWEISSGNCASNGNTNGNNSDGELQITLKIQ